MTEKVIGILGGMGPEATLNCFQKIIQNTPAEKDQEHLRILIDCNPKIPDRTAAICGEGASPVPAMLDSVRSLNNAGADFIIIPCVSAHAFLEEMQHQTVVPFIAIYDAAARTIEQNYPSIKKVGLLATSGTIRSGFFQNRLKQSGITTIIPEEAEQQRVMTCIYTIKADSSAKGREAVRISLLHVVNRLLERGAQGIIAGCTEIPLVLKSEDLNIPFFDTLLILARTAIEIAGRQPTSESATS
jgi:aspartate racemase